MEINWIIVLIVGIFCFLAFHFYAKSKYYKNFENLFYDLCICNCEKTDYLINLDKLYNLDVEKPSERYVELKNEMIENEVMKTDCACHESSKIINGNLDNSEEGF